MLLVISLFLILIMFGIILALVYIESMEERLDEWQYERCRNCLICNMYEQMEKGKQL